jgi:putative hemolysin
MNQYWTDVAILLLLLLANGFLAMAEMAIVSARRPRLQTLAAAGNQGAAKALLLAEDPGDFLSTVQIGITAIGIVTGVFSGAALDEPVADLLRRIPWLQPYAAQSALVLVIVMTTYLALIVAELTPKRIALNSPEEIASLVAPPMDLLSRIAHPLVLLLDHSSAWLTQALGIRPSDAPAVTDEEVRIMLRQGTKVGVFEPIEEEIVAQVFRLSDRRVSAIMTPRPEIDWIDVDQDATSVSELILNSSHSRFPLAEGSLDRVIGILFVRDLVAQQLLDEGFDLRALARPVLFLPESMTALDVIENLRESRAHIALVINEYGGLEGLVTINDVAQAILGAVESTGGEEDAPVVQREDGSWLVDGMWPVDLFQSHFHLASLPSQDDLDYQTVGGMIMALLEQVPAVGNHLEIDGYRLEVVDMDGWRVDKVLVQKVPSTNG